MNDQMVDQQQDLQSNIQQQEAITQFERWVNENRQIDLAYSNGTLSDWLKKKADREIQQFTSGARNE